MTNIDDLKNEVFVALDDIPTIDTSSLSLLLLADTDHASQVVKDHIASLSFNTLAAIDIVNPITDGVERICLDNYDAVIIHYSIFILKDYFLDAKWRLMLSESTLVKAQIIQDEHRNVAHMIDRQEVLGIDLLFSSLSVDNMRKVYGHRERKDYEVDGKPIYGGRLRDNVITISCLPGYVLPYMLEFSAPELDDREFDIVYRGSSFSYEGGAFGLRKHNLVSNFNRVAADRSLRVNASNIPEDRISGKHWLAFLGSSRGALGLEGGSSLFDIEGDFYRTLLSQLSCQKQIDVDDFFKNLLHAFDYNVVHSTITPRIFEAIAAGTCNILLPGSYRGVLESGRHFFELKDDMSNYQDLVDFLANTSAQKDMVNTAKKEILSRVEYSASNYAAKVASAIQLVIEKKKTN